MSIAARAVEEGQQSRALQWSGNPYGNGYGVEMEWKWGTICENRMDWIGFGAECRLKTI